MKIKLKTRPKWVDRAWECSRLMSFVTENSSIPTIIIEGLRNIVV